MTFRSLPRPSSAISALAFTLCSYMLDLLRTLSPSLPLPVPLASPFPLQLKLRAAPITKRLRL